jgi:hypothetical protein
LPETESRRREAIDDAAPGPYADGDAQLREALDASLLVL